MNNERFLRLEMRRAWELSGFGLTLALSSWTLSQLSFWSPTGDRILDEL